MQDKGRSVFLPLGGACRNSHDRKQLQQVLHTHSAAGQVLTSSQQQVCKLGECGPCALCLQASAQQGPVIKQRHMQWHHCGPACSQSAQHQVSIVLQGVQYQLLMDRPHTHHIGSAAGLLPEA